MNSAPCVLRLNHLNTFDLWTAVVNKMWRRLFVVLLPIFGKLFFYVMKTIFRECKEHVIYELKENICNMHIGIVLGLSRRFSSQAFARDCKWIG